MNVYKCAHIGASARSQLVHHFRSAHTPCQRIAQVGEAQGTFGRRRHSTSAIATRPVGLPIAATVKDLMLGGARVTHAAHTLWQQIVAPGDTVVDATCGNGFDSLILADLVGSTGTLHAFDVQPAAIARTQAKFEHPAALRSGAAAKRCTVHYHCESHERIGDHVQPGTASLVSFNLGYMPGGDHSILTTVDSTERAVSAALQVLKPAGVCSIAAYVGHEEGRRELEMLSRLLSNLNTHKWIVTEASLVNRPTAPRLFTVFCRPDGGHVEVQSES